jgi:Recombination endonuclease VII
VSTAPFGEPTSGHVVSRLVVLTTPTPPARDHCPNDGPRPRWLPPDRFHCAQDHYLQATYGITCDDYWSLFAEQDGRCAICRMPPKGRRLVVDHDHRTGSVDGLCHFACNRWLPDRVRRYLADPPGRRLGVQVTPAKLREIQAADRAKRKREQQRREAKPVTTDPPSNLDRLRAMTNQGGTHGP